MPEMSERIAELRRDLESNPLSRQFYQLGELLRRDGRAAEAITVLRGGLGHHPRYVAAWVSLGRACLDHSQPKDAAKALHEAIALDAQNPVAWRLLGEAQLAAGDRFGSLDAMQHALQLAPSDEVLRAAVESLSSETWPPDATPPASDASAMEATQPLTVTVEPPVMMPMAAPLAIEAPAIAAQVTPVVVEATPSPVAERPEEPQAQVAPAAPVAAFVTPESAPPVALAPPVAGAPLALPPALAALALDFGEPFGLPVAVSDAQGADDVFALPAAAASFADEPFASGVRAVAPEHVAPAFLDDFVPFAAPEAAPPPASPAVEPEAVPLAAPEPAPGTALAIPVPALEVATAALASAVPVAGEPAFEEALPPEPVPEPTTEPMPEPAMVAEPAIVVTPAVTIEELAAAPQEALPAAAAAQAEAELAMAPAPAAAPPPAAPAELSGRPTLTLARLHLQQQDFPAAIAILERLVAANPDDQEAHDLLELVHDMMAPLPGELPLASLRERKIAALQAWLASLTLGRELLNR